ncbi:MAG TPA: aminotransferase class I/II-fold pyridoxal phosphate-dependent enzyme [Solirubrobacteraceae bacterium]|jgi:perosamine synthetase
MSYRIPWAKPYIGEEEIAVVTATLRAGRLSMGGEVAAFEREVASFSGRRHAIAVSNGTVALDVALQLAGIGPGDEVLVSSLSYIATTNSILRAGAVPVFCDVDPVTLNLDPADAARRITPRTRGLLAADYCGSSLQHAQLDAMCDAHGLTMVLDGAQSMGTLHAGRPALSYGTIATTSFHTAKAFLCGEGGMVLCDDPKLAERCRRLRGQGEVPGRKYVHDVFASNHRITELAAAIGRVQLGRAPEVLARRREILARYDAALAAEALITSVGHLPGSQPAGFSYAVQVPERDLVATMLDGVGIETRSLYPLPAYRQPMPEYAPYADEQRPCAEAASATVLNLPVFFELTDAEIDDVAGTLVTAVGVATAQPVAVQPVAA